MSSLRTDLLHVALHGGPGPSRARSTVRRCSSEAPAPVGGTPGSTAARGRARASWWSASMSTSSVPVISARSSRCSRRQRGGQHRVVRTAGHQPGLRGRPEVGVRPPHCAGDRELRERRVRAAPPRPCWRRSRKRSPRSAMPRTTAGPGAASKTSRTGSSRPPMPSGWISSEGRRGGDRRADLEHVRAEDLLLAGDQVVGVVLHEGRAAGQARRPRP